VTFLRFWSLLLTGRLPPRLFCSIIVPRHVSASLYYSTLLLQISLLSIVKPPLLSVRFLFRFVRCLCIGNFYIDSFLAIRFDSWSSRSNYDIPASCCCPWQVTCCQVIDRPSQGTVSSLLLFATSYVSLHLPSAILHFFGSFNKASEHLAMSFSGPRPCPP
jgi:hypothetical protein